MIDRRSARRRQTGETGAILPFLALGFVAITFFLIMTVDVGVGYMARGQLQNIADSASRAALEMRTDNNMNPDQAAAAAANLAQRMVAANGVPGADVIFGDYDFASMTFRPGGMELNPAVRVVASRMAQGGGANSIPGLLGDMNVMASSTATFKCRLLALVEDVSASFGPSLPEFPGAPPGGNELEEAKAGLQSLVSAMSNQMLPGDRIALVSFDNASETILELTPLPQAEGTIRTRINSLTPCNSQDCNGTNQGVAINAAVDLLTEDPEICSGVVDRLMIVVSDGQPCFVSQLTDPAANLVESITETARLRAEATAAVNRAETEGISVSSVFYARDGDSCGAEPDVFSPDPRAFSESLVKGPLGRSFVTPTADEIGDRLLDILKLFRVSVVG